MTPRPFGLDRPHRLFDGRAATAVFTDAENILQDVDRVHAHEGRAALGEVTLHQR